MRKVWDTNVAFRMDRYREKPALRHVKYAEESTLG